MGRQDEIQLIAYHIWEEEDCCYGRNCEHWLKAEAIWETKQKDKATPVGAKATPTQVQRNSSKATRTGS
jgi:hypothetical protein